GGSLGALRGDVEATGLDDQGRSVVESHMAVSLVVVHVGTDVGSLDLDSVQGVPPRPVAGQVCRLHGAGGGGPVVETPGRLGQLVVDEPGSAAHDLVAKGGASEGVFCGTVDLGCFHVGLQALGECLD